MDKKRLLELAGVEPLNEMFGRNKTKLPVRMSSLMQQEMARLLGDMSMVAQDAADAVMSGDAAGFNRKFKEVRQLVDYVIEMGEGRGPQEFR